MATEAHQVLTQGLRACADLLSRPISWMTSCTKQSPHVLIFVTSAYRGCCHSRSFVKKPGCFGVMLSHRCTLSLLPKKELDAKETPSNTAGSELSLFMVPLLPFGSRIPWVSVNHRYPRFRLPPLQSPEPSPSDCLSKVLGFCVSGGGAASQLAEGRI